MLPAAGTDVEQMIGGADDAFFVLDDEQRVPLVAQVAHHVDHAVHVARVQADARLVHHEERVDQARAETAREIDALDLAAAERARRPIEREIPEADAVEVMQPVLHLGAEHFAGAVAGRDQRPQVRHHVFQARDGHPPPVGQRRAPHTEIQRLRLQASAAADRARRVSAVAAEEDADVHLVEPRFAPLEKPAHAIPLAVFPRVLRIRTVAFNDPALVRLGQLVIRAIDIHAARLGGFEQVALAFGHHAALEGPHQPSANGQRFVRQRAIEIDADDAPEPPALGTRAEGIVERKQRGCRLAQGDIAGRAMPAARKVQRHRRAVVGAQHAGLALAVVKGGFEGFLQAGRRSGGVPPTADSGRHRRGRLFRDDAGRGFERRRALRGGRRSRGGRDAPATSGQFHPILHHLHHAGQRRARESFRLVGSIELAVEPHAQEPLLLQKREEIRGRGLRRHGHRENHQHVASGQRRGGLPGGGGRRVGAHRLATTWARGFREPWKEQL